jgi:hypothetical protein
MFDHADGDSATAEGGKVSAVGAPRVIRSARSCMTTGVGDTGTDIKGTTSIVPARATVALNRAAEKRKRRGAGLIPLV